MTNEEKIKLLEIAAKVRDGQIKLDIFNADRFSTTNNYINLNSAFTRSIEDIYYELVNIITPTVK